MGYASGPSSILWILGVINMYLHQYLNNLRNFGSEDDEKGFRILVVILERYKGKFLKVCSWNLGNPLRYIRGLENIYNHIELV